MQRPKSTSTLNSRLFYLFNVVNPDEVRNGTGKPILQEGGPYVFEEIRTKKYYRYYDDGDKLEYCDNRKYRFNQELSKSLDDEVTVANIPFLWMFNVAAKESLRLKYNVKTRKFLRNMFLMFEKKFPDEVDIFLTTRVEKLLFDGIYICNFLP